MFTLRTRCSTTGIILCVLGGSFFFVASTHLSNQSDFYRKNQFEREKEKEKQKMLRFFVNICDIVVQYSCAVFVLSVSPSLLCCSHISNESYSLNCKCFECFCDSKWNETAHKYYLIDGKLAIAWEWQASRLMVPMNQSANHFFSFGTSRINC